MKVTKNLAAGAAVLLLLTAPAAMAMGNPASAFCEEMGGRSANATLASGDEIGLCYLTENKIVEEWTLFRMFDGKKPSNYENPFLSN